MKKTDLFRFFFHFVGLSDKLIYTLLFDLENKIEQPYEKNNKMVCAPNEDSDQA